MDLQGVWNMQNLISPFHMYIMAINSSITAFYILRHPSHYFNLKQVTGQSTYFLFLGFFSMPLYYFFESYTTLHLCKAFLHYSCKYIIHHILTITLTIVVYSYNYFNLTTMLTPAVHGIMNLGYYYSPNTEYIMCRWYGGCTILSLFYYLWVFYYFPTHRKGAGIVLLTGLALAYNNINTPELVQMCEINDRVSLSYIGEWVIHMLGLIGFVGLIKYFSKEKLVKVTV